MSAQPLWFSSHRLTVLVIGLVAGLPTAAVADPGHHGHPGKPPIAVFAGPAKRLVLCGKIHHPQQIAAKCALACVPPERWTGQWHWVAPRSKKAVCECELAAPPPQPPGPPAPPLPPPPGPRPQPPQPAPPPELFATIFEDPQFRGRSAELVVGRYDARRLGIANDSLSSLRVPQGLRVTLFEHDGFAGRSKQFGGDAPFVGKEFNDQTSSIVVEYQAVRPTPLPPSSPPPQPQAPQPQLPPPPVQIPPPPLPPPVQVPPPAEPVARAMSDQLFAKLIHHLEEASFPKAQLAALEDELRVGSKLNTRQLIKIMDVLSFPDYQVQGVVLAWPSVVDPQNVPDVLAAFTFPSHRDQVRKALKLK